MLKIFKFGRKSTPTEIRIGQTFNDGRTTLKCVESGICEHNGIDCYYWFTESCDDMLCTSDKRTDGKSVVFLKQ